MIAKAVNVPSNLAELHQQLGEVPLERIRMKPPPGTATEEDVLTAGKPVCELIDGVLVEKAVGTEESIIAWALSMQLGQYVVANDLGVLAVGDGSLRLGAGSRVAVEQPASHRGHDLDVLRRVLVDVRLCERCVAANGRDPRSSPRILRERLVAAPRSLDDAG